MKNGKAVVALESTIITHGMEYPTNRDTAFAVEDIVRGQGAVPATIAILNGVIKVGLSKEEIQYLSNELVLGVTFGRILSCLINITLWFLNVIFE